MTYEERRDAFVKAVLEASEKYQIGLIGTCWSESIYGEITFVDKLDFKKCGWRDAEHNLFNFHEEEG